MTRLDFPSHHRSPHLLSQLVAGWHGVALDAIASLAPHPRIAAARQDMVLILTEFTGLTETQIGAALGGRSQSATASILRQARRAEVIHHEVHLRLVSLRAAALALPGDNDPMPEGHAPAAQYARHAIANGAGGAFERLALAVISAAEVLRDSKLTHAEARHAAFCLLTRPGNAPASNVIPLKGNAS